MELVSKAVMVRCTWKNCNENGMPATWVNDDQSRDKKGAAGTDFNRPANTAYENSDYGWKFSDGRG